MNKYLAGVALLCFGYAASSPASAADALGGQELQAVDAQQVPPVPPPPPPPPTKPLTAGEQTLRACLAYLQDPNNNRYPVEAHMIRSTSDGDQIRAAIACTLSNMRKNRTGLERDLGQQRGRQTSFDSTLIGVGIGTSAAAFLGGSARLIGSLAIGSGGLAQYRSYYGNEARGTAYLRALAASRCVSSTAQPLLAARPEALWKEIHALKRGIGVVQSGLGSLPPGAATDAAASDQQDAAARAISAANAAIAALNAESNALIYAPAVIDQAHDQINNFRDSKKQRVSAGFDVASVQNALVAGIDASSDAVTKTRTASAKLADAVKATVTAQAKVDPASVGDAPAIAQDEDATNADMANAEPSAEEISDEVKVLAPRAALLAAPPPPQKGETPALMAAAAAKSGKAPLIQVNRLISALNQTSARALDVVPDPSIARINTSILACTAGLAD